MHVSDIMTESDNFTSCKSSNPDFSQSLSDFDELYLSLVKSPSGATFELELTVSSRDNKVTLSSLSSLASTLCTMAY